MANRSSIYNTEDWVSPYPSEEEQIHKRCDICGIDMVINNWPDKGSRTPRYKGFIVCAECDPRHPDDHYVKEGYRILHPRRLRIIKIAQVTRSLARHGCLDKAGPPGEEWTEPGCNCAGCIARKLMPGVPYD